MGDTDTEDAHSAVDVRSEGTDEDEEYEMEEEDDEEEEEDDTLKRPANRRFGVKEKQPQFQAGSNEIDSANVVHKGRRAPKPSSSTTPSTKTSTSTTTKTSPSTSTSTKKRSRATERAALQAKKKPRQEEKPITEKERKKATKNAKDVATSRSKIWRQIVLNVLEDHRGKLPPSDLFKLILDSKLTQTARWFADLGLGRHQVWFAFVV